MFLTGGTGLVGSHVAEVLRANRLEVRALHRARSDTGHLAEIGCELVQGQVEDGEGALAPLLAGSTALVHAAALTHTGLPWPRVRSVNVEGTRNIFRAAASVGVPRAVHISSVAVYGDQEGPIDESADLDFPLHPREKYARSKREAEAVAQEVSRAAGMVVAALRPAAVYGERDRVFTPTVVQGLRLPIHPLPGGGRTRLAAVYAGNLAQAVFAGLVGANEVGVRAYNVADDHPITQRWLYSGLAAHLGVPFRPVSVSAALVLALARSGDALGLRIPGAEGLPLRRAARLAVRENPYISVRVREELGWKPMISLEEALARTASWIPPEVNEGGASTDD